MYCPDRTGEIPTEMKLSSERAVIEPAKLRDYLLSVDHPQGRSKALYLSALGYNKDNWGRLAIDIRQQILPLDARHTEDSPWGRSMRFLVC
jgi:hypothetical protein